MANIIYREAEDGNERIKFPGSIKKNTHVLAVMRDNKTWELAKVMDVRERVIDDDLDETPFDRWIVDLKSRPDDEDSSNEKAEKAALSHHRANKRTLKRDYEYYITYLAHERRNDRWLAEIGLKIDEQRINDEQERIDEHKRKEEARN